MDNTMKNPCKEMIVLEHEIDMRTMQRDIDDFRAYYAERTSLVGKRKGRLSTAGKKGDIGLCKK